MRQDDNCSSARGRELRTGHFPFGQRQPERLPLNFALLEKSKSGSHDICRGIIIAADDLAVDETLDVVAER